MNNRKMITLVCLGVLGAMMPRAKADESNQKTVFTFSGPVEIPGKVLLAGTYVFKLVDSQSDRHIVQIFSKDEKTVYATILAIPNYRLKATSKTVITFRERPAGEPEALRAWFYPGKAWGEEFVYHKSVAIELARSESTTVLSTPADIPVEVETIQTVDEPIIAQLREAPVQAIQPTGVEVELAQVVTPPPAEQVALPATASSLPLIGLLGLMFLGAAFVLGAFAKRTA